ncbi:RraA-like protein [Fomitiporia mediterranea MF3/22]|uniref:RraA-like protein n=1 Tax=Fomitiporia mediterranea (strain MF3/22) TaxID=694068 RepID=UPI0004408A7D|nr:RraA-like protein [Fomitiporia mediterranea MF3/22]EJD02945.1 RraA-like protein [Fomitiporia mediterranea MF3/22]
MSTSATASSSSATSALAQFTSCELSDALIKLGSPHGGHIPDLRRQSAWNGSADQKICGPAYTVRMVRTSEADAPKPAQHFVDTAEKGAVIVIEAPPLTKNAVWGGLMTAGAQTRGALGVVISGRCRDIAEQNAFQFPVFARGTSTLGQSPFTRPSAVQVPLVIEAEPQGCGFPAITINPGDFILADEDGVVCVPADSVPVVVQIAEKGREADARCMEDIKAGVGVQVSFKKYRGK